MKMEHLREFVVLGQRLSFTKASEELFVSQATLSRHMVILEDELGQTLLIRDTHNVELTPAGRIALDHFRTIAEKYDGCLKQLKQLKMGTHGYLRIAETYHAVDRYLSVPLRNFMVQYPHVKIEFLALQPYEVEQAVMEGRGDLGLTLLYGNKQDERFKYHTIANETFCVAIPSDHPLARRKKIRFSDLSGQLMVTLRNEHTHREYVDSFFKKYDMYPKQWIYGEQIDSLNSTMLAHRAVTIAPEHLNDVPHRGISFVPLDEPDCYVSIVYIHRKDNQNPTVHLFLDELAKQSK